MQIINSLIAQEKAQRFPKLEAKSLTREKIIFPDDLSDPVNILILVFKQDAQRIVDTWAKIILEEYEPQANISYYEVPMISTWWVPISWQIDNWMRDGIPEDFHDNTTTFYGDRGPYFEQLNMKDKDSCYLFILDSEGYIRFREEGPRNPAKEQAFRKAILSLSNQG